MRAAFATYAQDHEAASIRRCCSTWNVLCTFLYTGEQLAANPMQLVGRPKLAKALPKALPGTAVEALLETVAQDRDSKRQTDWAERDLAIILTSLLAGLRADELRQAALRLESIARKAVAPSKASESFFQATPPRFRGDCTMTPVALGASFDGVRSPVPTRLCPRTLRPSGCPHHQVQEAGRPYLLRDRKIAHGQRCTAILVILLADGDTPVSPTATHRSWLTNRRMRCTRRGSRSTSLIGCGRCVGVGSISLPRAAPALSSAATLSKS